MTYMAPKTPKAPRNAPRLVNLTMAVAKNAPLPDEGDYILRDTNITGLGLRVYKSGAKTWIFQKKLGRRPVRVVLGPFPTVGLEDKYNGVVKLDGARTLAIKAAAKISARIDPNLEKRNQQRQTEADRDREALTVSVIWKEYAGADEDDAEVNKDGTEVDKGNVAEVAPSTIAGWKRAGKKLKRSPIWSKPFLAVGAADLVREFDRLARSADKSKNSNKGLTQASATMRYLRAAFRKAILMKDLENVVNPFSKFNKLRPDWYKVNKRKRIVANSEGDLAKWWKAVDDLRNKTDPRAKDAKAIADYLILSLLWGGRRTEILSLKWNEVNLSNGVVSFIKTKNGIIHDIPITAYARSILERRKLENDAQNSPSEYVFPASRTGYKTKAKTHLQEPKTSISEVAKAAGIPFTPHDLRRTFGTLLNEQDVSKYVIERALNHAPTDTAGKHYVQQRLKYLSKTYQELEDQILVEAGVTSAKPTVLEVPHDQWRAYQAWVAKQSSRKTSTRSR